MPWQRHRVLRRSLVMLGIIGLLTIGLYGWYRYSYPHGATHRCLKVLGMALLQYAQENHGHFPAGAGCPEASLSLLYQEPYGLDAGTLCGKTKSAEAATKVLERGQRLGPDTCDWHYVEGLTLSDDPRVAIAWDKTGLDHNGGRLPGGGHCVLRLQYGGWEEVIADSQWPQFLEEQDRLMKARVDAARKQSNR